ENSPARPAARPTALAAPPGAEGPRTIKDPSVKLAQAQPQPPTPSDTTPPPSDTNIQQPLGQEQPPSQGPQTHPLAGGGRDAAQTAAPPTAGFAPTPQEILPNLSAERQAEATTISSNVLSGSEATLRATTDAGDLIYKSANVVGVEVLKRAPFA